MEDKFEALRGVYHEKMYSKSNVLDGKFVNSCTMYRLMYGRFMPENKDAAIIDIGCGPGQFLKFCLNMGYSNVCGIDLSEGQVGYARNNVTKNVILGDGMELLSKSSNSFDLVVANDLIEHLPKDKGIQFTGLVKQSLKTGGRILMKTGNMAAFGGLVMWCNGLDHECGYTEKSLRNLVAMWDFQKVEIIPYYGPSLVAKAGLHIAHSGLRLLYKYLYAGDYPKIYTKVIAVTGVV